MTGPSLPSDQARDVGFAHTLCTLLTAISGSGDEFDRARLAATGLPSVVPCRVSGIALLDEAETRWRLVLQQDGRQLASNDTEEVVAEMKPLLEEALHGATLLAATAGDETQGYTIPPALERLGVRRLVAVPLKTLRSRLGILFVGRDADAPFSRDDELLLLTVAEHSAVGIENVRFHRSLEQRSESLERQNELILDSAGEGIYGLDSAGKTTFVNPAATRMLGWTASEIIGQPMHDLLHHTRPDGSAYPREECPIYAAFKDGQVHRVEDEVFWRKDGSSFPVEYTSTPISEGGALEGAVVVFWDVTARKRAEEKLRRALLEVEELKDRLQAENVYLQEEIRTRHNFEEIIGESPAIQNVLEAIETVAPTEANVLITGETGTGKELVARAVHDLSSRKDRTLIKVNCASIPRELFESEFFGHVRGAFTGAIKDRVGRFQLADRGTLFLDEVGEIPLEMQSKLLRVLQEGHFERVGGEKTHKVDVRVIAATNRDLKQEVEAGRFRQDLYYRLNVFPIEVAPLRGRKEDIPLLATHFLELAGREMNRPKLRLTQANVLDLQGYDWPGNVREMQNVIERAVITSRSRALRFDLPGQRGTERPPSRAAVVESAETETSVIPDSEMRRRERENLLAALGKSGWKVYGPGGAGELLGIKPTTLASRIQKMGLKKPD